MNFTKVEGAGNDFVLIESSGFDYDWPKMAITMCDRHYGIGGDGLLLLSSSPVADFQMRMFNPDGSEAEACGNGLRALVRYVLDKGLVNGTPDHIFVETKAGIREVRLHETGNKVSRIQVGMGMPRFAPKDIPVAIEGSVDITSVIDYPITIDGMKLELSFVSMGNPHAVCFLKRPVSDFPLSQIGPKIEGHSLFPKRINFEVANVISRRQVEARVWERGAGETLACGTGACAVAVVAQVKGYVDKRVDITLAGGILDVEWDGKGEVFLSGPASVVFSGEWTKEVKKA